jgi:LPPG:FO 2-phospho-L-lactate transferase
MGQSLSAVTRHLCARLGITHAVAPMTDDDVRTIIQSDEGTLEFQQYFVARKCEPRVLSVEFCGASVARPSPALDDALNDRTLSAIIICPSNPILSIEPILQIADVRRRIAENGAPVVAISPIVGGKALKGPAAKILSEMGRDATAFEVSRLYQDVLDGIVIDARDSAFKPEIEALGLHVMVTDTIMNNRADQSRLALLAIEFASALSTRSQC